MGLERGGVRVTDDIQVIGLINGEDDGTVSCDKERGKSEFHFGHVECKRVVTQPQAKAREIGQGMGLDRGRQVNSREVNL